MSDHFPDITKKVPYDPPAPETDTEGPRGTYGCACMDRDSVQCAAIRYGMDHWGQPCECPCHQWDDDDEYH